jgi:hypothetical protein
MAIAVSVAEGQVQRLWSILNPDKLRALSSRPVP